jgi:hypothetical protein
MSTPSTDRTADREQKLRALQERLTSGVEQLVTGEDWKRAIEFAARFRGRSFANTILIASQAAEAYQQGRVPSPYPTYVAGYRQWQQLGRQVRAGSVGYQIVAPVSARFATHTPADPASWRRLRRGEHAGPGEVTRTRMVGVKPATVFDAAMTDGDAPIPEPPRPQLLRGQAPPGLHESLVVEIEARGFTVVDVPNAAAIGGANGLTDFAAKQVSIRADMDPAARCKTAAHEAGHLALGHGPGEPGGVSDGMLHRGIAEVEAESFALVIAASHGLATDNYTIPYVATWAASVPGKTPVEVVQATAEKVCKTASQVLARLDTAQVGDGTPPGLTREGRDLGEAHELAAPAGPVAADTIPESEPPQPRVLDPWAVKVGDRLLRDDTLWQVVRITPAGAGATSRSDGPTIHAKIVREDGTLSDYTADIWADSISNPAAAFTRHEAPGAGGGAGGLVEPSTVAEEALPGTAEVVSATARGGVRLLHAQHGSPAQVLGAAASRPDAAGQPAGRGV